MCRGNEGYRSQGPETTVDPEDREDRDRAGQAGCTVSRRTGVPGIPVGVTRYPGIPAAVSRRPGSRCPGVPAAWLPGVPAARCPAAGCLVPPHA
jgi:hypothetical protein